MDCRIFPHLLADGPANMARDEAMLDAVADDPSCALLRTYGWTVPTLSLGYFQSIAEAEADPRWRDTPIVRRPTGGGAIWHHHELTYALVVPGTYPLSRPAAALYHAVHDAIGALLRSQGVEAVSRGPVRGPRTATRPFLCFHDRDPEDLVAGDSKIVGGAQRRRAGAILQHGSLLLKRDAATPDLPGAADLAPVSADPRVWSDRLVACLPRSLGLIAAVEDFPDHLMRQAAILERQVYRNPDWTRRR